MKLLILLLLLIIFFQTDSEGFSNKKEEVAINENWKIQPISPTQKEINEFLKRGISKAPKNLAFLSRETPKSEWKTIMTLYMNGNIEGKFTTQK